MTFSPPQSVLIIGSGSFGLSTAYTLAKDPLFEKSKITLVDRLPFPAADGASIDTSRIIRADYADPLYAALAAAAQESWRGEWGADHRYAEPGLVLTSDPAKGEYVMASLDNVQQLMNGTVNGKPAIEALRTHADVSRAAGAGASGPMGYINRKSGWADCGAAMRWLREQVSQTGRVEFVTGAATRLLFSADRRRITGARIAPLSLPAFDLPASLTILAAGAWTPTLIDLRGRVTATGQPLAYIPLSDTEAAHLSSLPTQLNLSTGMFYIPPSHPQRRPVPQGDGGETIHLKFARHWHGYTNPKTIPHPEIDGETMTVSVPHTRPDVELASQPLPAPQLAYMRQFARQVLPGSSVGSRPFSHTRICHYADTPTGDWLVTYHPSYSKSLVVATGDSGHAFKFLPVLGRCVLQVVLGPDGNDPLIPPTLLEQWGWREAVEGEWTTMDGSRGGEKGLTLDESLAKGKL